MLCALMVVPARSAIGQKFGCARIRDVIGMVHSRSVAALDRARARAGAGDDYRAQTVYAGKKFELSPSATTAAELLNTIPQDDEQQVIWMTFGDSLCDQESLAEMAELSRFGERLQRNVPRAVLLAPAKMSRYVSYATLATRDPHSKYAMEMKDVCQRRRSELQASIMTMTPDSRSWFEEHVFDVRRCQPKALPESE